MGTAYTYNCSAPSVHAKEEEGRPQAQMLYTDRATSAAAAIAPPNLLIRSTISIFVFILKCL